MKKILAIIIVICLAAGMIGAGTWAVFSDTETVSGNSFTAGTLDLRLSGGTQSNHSVTGTWTFSSMKPGDTGGSNGALTIENLGTINGYLNLDSIGVNVDQTTNHPESKTHTGQSLGTLLKVWVFIDDNGNGTKDGNDIDIYGTSSLYAAIGSISSTYTINKPILASGTSHITLKYNWVATTSDNDAQGDILTLTVTVKLNQEAI